MLHGDLKCDEYGKWCKYLGAWTWKNHGTPEASAPEASARAHQREDLGQVLLVHLEDLLAAHLDEPEAWDFRGGIFPKLEC